MKDAERKAEKESISKIEAYKKFEKHVYRRIEKDRVSDEKKNIKYDYLESELDKAIRDLNVDLLDIEIKL